MSAILRRSRQQKIFCIGGRSIYEEFYPHANELFQTVIHAELNGNISFRVIDSKRDVGNFKMKNILSQVKKINIL